MEVIDVDSHVTVVKGLESTPFVVQVLPDGGHLIEFNGVQLDLAPPNGKTRRPGKATIDACTTWDLNRRLADLEGLAQRYHVLHSEPGDSWTQSNGVQELLVSGTTLQCWAWATPRIAGIHIWACESPITTRSL